MYASDRRGVVSYISVLQLILLSIAAGAIIYGLMITQLQVFTDDTLDTSYSDVSIDSKHLDEDQLTMYVRNLGDVPVEVDRVYVDNTVVGGVYSFEVNDAGTSDDVIPAGGVGLVTVTKSDSYTADQVYEFTIITKNEQTLNLRINWLGDTAPPLVTVHDYRYVELDTSDVDSTPDIGDLTGFNNVKIAPDSIYASLSESLIDGANSYDYIDSSTSNVDGLPDTGAYGSFGNMKNVDSLMASLTEQTTSSPETGYHVLHGSFEFASGTTSVQGIGDTIDLDHSFLIFYTAGTSAPSTPNEGSCMGYLSSSTEVTFERQASSNGLYVSWFVVECLAEEFTVRGRGLVSLGVGVESTMESVAGVLDEYQCTVMYGGHRGEGANTGDWEDAFCNVHLTAVDTVTVSRHSGSIGTGTSIRYEVVEWSSDYNIYTGEEQVTSTTVTDLISGSGSPSDLVVDLDRSIMFANWWTEQNGIQQVQVYYSITGTNEVTIGQYNNGRYPVVRWYVVEFPVEASPSIQRFSYNWDPTTSSTSLSNSISAVNTSTTFIKMSCSTSGTGTAFRRDFNLPRLDSATSWSETQYNAANQNYDQHETRGSIIELPYSSATINHVLDLEAQFTSVETGAEETELAILTDALGAEDLSVSIWDTVLGDWSLLASDLIASSWNNYTITGFVDTEITLRFQGGAETSDTVQDSWSIDAVVIRQSSQVYRIDQEMQWTTCDSSLDYVELCIYTGSLGSEALRVQIWDKNLSEWDIMAASLFPNTWNNVTVKSYLVDDLTVTIRFIDSDTVTDSSQDTWLIDSVLLHGYE